MNFYSSLDESFESEKAVGADDGRGEKAEKFLVATAEDALPKKSSSGTKLNRSQTIAMPIKLTERSTDLQEDSNLSSSLPQLPDLLPPKETFESERISLPSPGKEIPKPPTIKLPIIAGGCQIELATLEARERMLASLKERVPRVEVGVSNSPEREPTPVVEPEQ